MWFDHNVSGIEKHVLRCRCFHYAFSSLMNVCCYCIFCNLLQFLRPLTASAASTTSSSFSPYYFVIVIVQTHYTYDYSSNTFSGNKWMRHEYWVCSPLQSTVLNFSASLGNYCNRSKLWNNVKYFFIRLSPKQCFFWTLSMFVCHSIDWGSTVKLCSFHVNSPSTLPDLNKKT